MTDQTFPREFRLRSQADFDRVYQRDVVAADDVLVARGCENVLGYSRLGLSVSRKVGNAVVRNRWKRLMREAFRLTRDTLPAGIDFVLRPRRGAECNLSLIQQSLPKITRRIAKRLEAQST